MKLTRIFGIVLTLHLGVVFLLFLQPGCQTVQTVRESFQGMTTKKENLDASVTIIDGVAPQANATAQQAPVVDTPDMTSAQAAQGFNAPTANSQRYRPTRPTLPIQSENVSVSSLSLPQDESVATITEAPVPSPIQLPVIEEKPLPVLEPVLPIADSVTEEFNLNHEIYTVQRGDSLWRVARRLGTTVEALKAENNLRSNSLSIGQELILPLGVKPVPGSASSVPAFSQPASAVVSSGQVYTVVKGDTLSRIASRHGVRVQDLRSVNNISGSIIRIGQKLKIPQGGSVQSPRSSKHGSFSAPVSGGGVHTIRKGETLGKVARSYGVSVSDLQAWNGISNPNKIRVGQKIKISGVSGSAAANPAPVMTKSSSFDKPKPISTNLPPIGGFDTKPVTIDPVIGTKTEEQKKVDDLADKLFEQSTEITIVPIDDLNSN